MVGQALSPANKMLCVPMGVMDPEALVACIEKAFGELDRPPLEEMAAEDTYMDQSFIDGVGS